MGSVCDCFGTHFPQHTTENGLDENVVYASRLRLVVLGLGV